MLFVTDLIVRLVKEIIYICVCVRVCVIWAW